MKGRVLADKYRLEEELGRGGMGSVWRASHIELRYPVAVKLIDPVLAQTHQGRSRFLREARAASSLRSSHVVQVFDYGLDDGTPFLVMELLEGESLADRLEHRGVLTPTEVGEVLRQVGRALARAHNKGIVHRDLKPENVFIVQEDGSELVKVLDFGIAKVANGMAASLQTQTGLVLGTPYYMSPEQAEGRRELDARSDLWSLAVIAFECLLGKRPFDGDNLAQIILAICADELPVPSRVGEVPAGFDGWFARAAARNVEFRFADVQQLVAEFAALVAHSNSIVAPTERMDGAHPPVKPVHQPASAPPLTTSKPARTERSDDAAVAPATDARAKGSVAAESIATQPLVVAVTEEADPLSEPAHIPLNQPLKLSWYSVAPIVVMLGLGGGVWFWTHNTASVSEPADAATAATATAELGPEPATSRPASGLRELSDHAATSLTQRPPAVLGETKAAPAPPPSPALPKPAPSASQTQVAAPVSSPKPTTPSSSELYCTVHPISGRLVKASAGAPGSFRCHVHAISGQLKRSN